MVAMLVALFNVCFATGRSPTKWNTAKVKMLYKNRGKKNNCGDCRGISLLDVQGKIYEKVLENRAKAAPCGHEARDGGGGKGTTQGCTPVLRGCSCGAV